MTRGELIGFQTKYTVYHCPWHSIIPKPYHVFPDMRKDLLVSAKDLVSLPVIKYFNSWPIPVGFTMRKNMTYSRLEKVDPRDIENLIEFGYQGWEVELRKTGTHNYLFASKQIEDYDLFSVSVGVVLLYQY